MISPTVTPTLRNTLFTTIPSAGGIPYTDFGRVLDYSTQVGPFTIVDKSGEGNTATLYSGRGLTMDGVSDLIDFGSPTFSEPVTSVTGYARSTDTSINLGITSATLSGNDTWETFSADTAAKDYGDSQWFNGTDTEVVVSASSNTSIFGNSNISVAATINPSQTGSGETIIGTDNSSAGWRLHRTSTGNIQFLVRKTTSPLNYVTDGVCAAGESSEVVASLIAGVVAITINGVAQTFASSTNGAGTIANDNALNFSIGQANTGFHFSGLIYSINLGEDLSAAYTGLGATPWVDTIGSNDGTVSGVDQTVTEYFTNPYFILGTGYNGDLSDIRCLGATGTVLGHWTLADWSNPAGNTSNGKTIVDSGPNGYHGACTGCSGFTGEGIDPDVAGIVGLDDAQWFNGTDSEVTVPDSADFTISTSIDVSADVLLTSTAAVGILNKGGGSAGLREWRVEVNSSNEISFFVFDDSLSANVGASTSDFPTNELFTVRGYYDGSDIYIYINGVQKATTAGVIAIENLAADIQLGNTLSASRHLNGVVSNVSISVDGTEVAAYTGLGNDPWKDTIGTNDGTPSGTFVTVGQKRATIPQTADRNWNRYQWFNGVDAIVSASSVGVADIDFDETDSFEIEISFIESVGTPATFRRILSFDGDTGRYDVILGSSSSGADGGISFGVGTDDYWSTSGSVFDQGDFNSLKITVTAGTPILTVNGSPVAMATSGLPWISSNNSSLNIGAKNNSGYVQGFNGVIGSVSINNSSGARLLHYTGLGNDPWRDTIGSNDGTESGTFTRELVSASDANDQIDALGNAILEPRRNTQQINLFGEGEYSRTPDSDSLDLTTEATWELWGNFYGDFGTDKAFFSKYDSGNNKRSWLIYQNDSQEDGQLTIALSGSGSTISLNHIPVSDEFAQVALTLAGGVLRGYVNGSEVTVTQVGASSPPASLHVSDVPVLIGSSVGSASFAERKIGSAKIYNRVLTADEVLTNYNTQKSLYNL